MENNFINEPIDTSSLPRFEDVQLTPVDKRYLKIILLNITGAYVVVGIMAAAAFYFIEESGPFIVHSVIGYMILILLTLLISWVSFKNKAYSFRTYDVIYRDGAIAITTTIIPYNRVQHVAIQEGWLARILGLAEVHIFTAGGDRSDIQIPGIEKKDAENIKQLLMGKILKHHINE
jgi:membrane protein YdbS with pleckstrin-like domain